jgi:hypothetical protein
MKLPWRGRTRRGDGFGTEVSVVQKPELGARVRLVHSIDGHGQYAFDYPPAGATSLARDLLAASKHAESEANEIAGDEAPAAAMAIPKSRSRR